MAGPVLYQAAMEKKKKKKKKERTCPLQLGLVSVKKNKQACPSTYQLVDGRLLLSPHELPIRTCRASSCRHVHTSFVIF